MKNIEYRGTLVSQLNDAYDPEYADGTIAISDQLNKEPHNFELRLDCTFVQIDPYSGEQTQMLWTRSFYILPYGLPTLEQLLQTFHHAAAILIEQVDIALKKRKIAPAAVLQPPCPDKTRTQVEQVLNKIKTSFA